MVVMEETMETRVAKGTALNSEERNEKWGVTLSGGSRAGHFSKILSLETAAMVWASFSNGERSPSLRISEDLNHPPSGQNHWICKKTTGNGLVLVTATHCLRPLATVRPG